MTSNTHAKLSPNTQMEQNGTFRNIPADAPSNTAPDKQTTCDGQTPQSGADTFHDPHNPLSPIQQQAIQLLLAGRSATSICKTLDIGRTTLHRWKSRDPIFIAHLNAHMNSIQHDAAIVAHQLLQHTFRELRSAMNDRHGLDLADAFRILSLLRVHRFVHTEMTESPEVVAKQIELRTAPPIQNAPPALSANPQPPANQ